MPVFLTPGEYRRYRDLLHVTAVDSGCAVHAYVLMTNHVHLLVTPSEVTSAARLMKGLAEAYTPWFNRRHGRTGTLWEGRYRSAVVYAERYLLTCSRYIELNPVRARVVSRPEEYPWSSYRANAYGAEDALLTSHACYDALGDSAVARQGSYRALFVEALDETVLRRIRRGTAARSVVGPADFVTTLEERLRRRLSPQGRGGDRRSKTFRERGHRS